MKSRSALNPPTLSVRSSSAPCGTACSNRPAKASGSHGTVNQSEFASNYIKRIVTKSGLRITLNDSPGQESIHLATPAQQ